MKTLTFNTGRTYSEHGQRIAATIISDGVFFSDMDRGIASFLPGCPLEQSEIMRRYDYNENMEWSLPTDGKNPESRWELIEKLDASHSAPTPAAAAPVYPDCYLHVEDCKSGQSWISPIHANAKLILRRILERWIKKEFCGELALDGMIMPRIDGDYYAKIITDGRPPDSVVVWTSGGFYLKSTYQ